ncbi:MAG: hypothetical protein BGN87_07825 [Rhizobiales bacterium 65-79]|jgi:hypothetical protein|nr:hypothetical protein [Hyphomicrobiales bacterium]OJU02255.1 MAG: hypothetical protein BGN87_07825 [Rhizobiales bacterium 65-79]
MRDTTHRDDGPPSGKTVSGDRDAPQPAASENDMEERGEHGGKDAGTRIIQSGVDQDSTLLPMLIGGLVLIIIGMVFVMWLT